MAETTIGWCDYTFNPWIGCTKVSPACDHCYAAEWAARYYPAAKWGDFPRKRTGDAAWSAPKSWDRKAAAAGTRPFVFCASLADIFDNQVDPQWRRDAFELMRATPNLVWLLLTKRIGNAEALTREAGELPPNAALGATMCDLKEYDRDRIKLRDARDNLGALFSFVSLEPLLGMIILDKNAPDWIIVGGESGPRRREMDPDWARKLRDQSKELGRAFYFKQWPALRPKGKGCELDGREWKERPFVAPLPPVTSAPTTPSQASLFGEAA